MHMMNLKGSLCMLVRVTFSSDLILGDFLLDYPLSRNNHKEKKKISCIFHFFLKIMFDGLLLI